jgi:hypothetical protein
MSDTFDRDLLASLLRQAQQADPTAFAAFIKANEATAAVLAQASKRAPAVKSFLSDLYEVNPTSFYALFGQETEAGLIDFCVAKLAEAGKSGASLTWNVEGHGVIRMSIIDDVASSVSRVEKRIADIGTAATLKAVTAAVAAAEKALKSARGVPEADVASYAAKIGASAEQRRAVLGSGGGAPATTTVAEPDTDDSDVPGFDD